VKRIQEKKKSAGTEGKQPGQTSGRGVGEVGKEAKSGEEKREQTPGNKQKIDALYRLPLRFS